MAGFEGKTNKLPITNILPPKKFVHQNLIHSLPCGKLQHGVTVSDVQGDFKPIS